MISETFIGCIFILATLPGFFLFFRIVYFYAISINRWKITEGIVLESSTQYYQSDDTRDNDGWKLRIVYTYKIDGAEFHSEKYSKNIGILKSFKDRVDTSEAPKINQKVAVYYNPKNPQDAVLDNKFDYTNCIILIISIVGVLVGYNLIS
nr:DUF3592 domain-containing protein [uncultured Flavobacterium sp.]